ncbi:MULTISPECIES: VOC family protein [unclassified Sphingomonas]|uniref:VOC family protein n=1 Tax=unclassified Sphingomonas TaxID=196159 RepID=UPI0006F49105|nr:MULTISPECIES: VOC family protein [unclassified Sphingomonas]KQM61946.1 lactoylglutathione lyase [Sphingomonas sp. Leaf16]KQN13219.1 lactoylglutathione lyase [Sphingomonas sp. Leaf29]KQN20168.1 lactoylglutathione lyase [Sphingomonas sp. Leaf32]
MTVYATIGVVDPAISHAFYDAVLSTIGWRSHADFPGWRGYSKGGSGEGFVLWACIPFDSAPATAGNGTMIGFFVDSQAEVDAFHAAAMAQGGSDEGAPGLRPYGANWYAAYLRDPAGNKLAVVHNP